MIGQLLAGWSYIWANASPFCFSKIKLLVSFCNPTVTIIRERFASCVFLFVCFDILSATFLQSFQTWPEKVQRPDLCMFLSVSVSVLRLMIATKF